MSCARFLAAQGVEVHLYEEKPVLGGMAGDAIPAFRLTGDSLRRDIDAILKLGVRLHKDTPVDAALFDTLAEENDAVYIAVGAQESLPLGIPGEDAPGFWINFRSPPYADAGRASAPTSRHRAEFRGLRLCRQTPRGERQRDHRLPPHPQGNAR
ncbi:MAG: hypothetical protein ACLTTU_13835 [Bilophila wadsworthia]